MDDDGSRSLGYEEFKNGIAESGLNVSDESSKELFDEFDKDGSGTVSVDEFLRAIRVSPWNNFIVEFSFFFSNSNSNSNSNSKIHERMNGII